MLMLRRLALDGSFRIERKSKSESQSMKGLLQRASNAVYISISGSGKCIFSPREK
jgi:hypothetical protein